MTQEGRENRVFVRNLNLITSDYDFVTYFQKHYGGVIEGARIIRDQHGRSKGYGFISFIDRSIVNRVINENNHVIGGKRVVCKIASPKNKSPNVSKNNEIPQHLREVYIGNLTVDLSISQLKNYFSYFGPILNAYIVSDDNQKSLGYGFIEFEKASSVDLVQELRPHNINDGEIHTTRVYPREIPTYFKKPTNILYVSNYNDYVDENDIEEYFTQFGNIILVSRKLQRPQDFKFMEIQFDDYDAVDVICLADNHIINGCTVTVSKYLERNLNRPQIDPVMTQQPSFSCQNLSAQTPVYVSHSTQNQPERYNNDDDNTDCCGSSRNESQQRHYNDGNDSCTVL